MADATAEHTRRALNPTLQRYIRALTTPKGLIAIVLVIAITAVALLAPVLFPQGYDEQTRNSLAGASWAHPFGTDEIGRDLFVRSIYGLRTDLGLIYSAVPLSMAIGSVLGLLGIVSRRLGEWVQRGLDVIAGFPGLILGICIVVVVGTGWFALFLAITVAGLPSFGRLARATLLAQMNREYVIAATTLGVSKWKIMLRHILPNAAETVIAQGAVFVVAAVFIEAALSIVGLGLQPPEPSLGTLLNIGMLYVTLTPLYVLGPTAILILLALAFSLLADALNEAVNRR